jgi:hypothetical protein
LQPDTIGFRADLPPRPPCGRLRRRIVTSDRPIIPAPLDAGEDFQVGPELTVYQAAMIYAGRHPYEGFLRDGTVDDYLKFLKAGIPKQPKETRVRARARRSWTIYCDLMERIKVGTIKPVRREYQGSGELDPARTVIRLEDVAALATERGERPRYLRHIQGKREPIDTAGGDAQNEKLSRKQTVRKLRRMDYVERVTQFLSAERRYPTREEDQKWGSDHRYHRDEVRDCRNQFLPEEGKKGGPRKQLSDDGINLALKNLAAKLPS